MSGKRTTGKNRIYIIIAAGLALGVVLMVFFAFYNPNWCSTETNVLNGPISTNDQALKIAMPNINQYAVENNRTVKTVNATFFNSTSTKGATWEVVALFDLVRGAGAQDWIDGYTVSIWAKNGTVYYAKERGYY